MSDITILSCPICNNPKLREYGNGIYQCDVCETYFDKDENILLTEQEYIQTCNTEQLAGLVFNILLICSRCGDESQSDEEKIKKCPFGKIGCTKKDWQKWLKQPHKQKGEIR